MAGERRPRRKGQQGFGPGVCTVFRHPHPALSSRGPDPEPGARPRAGTSSAHWALQEAHGLGSCHFAEGGTGGPGAHSVQGAGGLLLASHTCLLATAWLCSRLCGLGVRVARRSLAHTPSFTAGRQAKPLGCPGGLRCSGLRPCPCPRSSQPHAHRALPRRLGSRVTANGSRCIAAGRPRTPGPRPGPPTAARGPGDTPPRLSPLSVSSAASSLCVPANCSSPHPLGERSSDCPPRARRCPWADVAQTDRTPPPWGWHGAGGVSIQT